MEARCKNCRWWGPDDEPVAGIMRVCNALSLKSDESGIAYDSGHHGEIFTGPEFGCRHWEAKE
jgi:hypothetical protein